MADDSASEVIEALRAEGLHLGCAESLTGGLVAAGFVAVPGASRVLRGAIVAYDPAVKVDLLGVDAALVGAVGTVDPRVAAQMADGVCRAVGADIGVATTGVAGPGPAEGHPAGTVFLAVAGAKGEQVQELALSGERAAVRAQAAAAAIDLVRDVLRGSSASRRGG
ncbi:CinA family protein [Janibacter sp. GXQ6167]|uniref:CinA family protein n=1 Tax=Janibacter sp. GXQ6167 TaxID=3240791 RepID=UPI003526085F